MYSKIGPVIAAVSLNYLAAYGFVVDQNLATAAIAFISTVGTVVAVITWLDRRIDAKIRANAELFKLELSALRKEVSQLRTEFENWKYKR